MHAKQIANITILCLVVVGARQSISYETLESISYNNPRDNDSACMRVTEMGRTSAADAPRGETSRKAKP